LIDARTEGRGESIRFERSGQIDEEVLLGAGILTEDQSVRIRPRVETPGAEVLAAIEKNGVAGRTMRAVGYGN